jgi:hypothetical protein
VVIEPNGHPQHITGQYAGVDGKFNVFVRSSDKYKVHIEKRGFLPFSEVIAREHMNDVESSISAEAIISGQITDSAGEPLVNARVQMVRLELLDAQWQMIPTAEASTNDLGEYRLFGLAPGSYYVRAFHQDLGGLLGLRMRQEAGETKNKMSPTRHLGVTYFPGTQLLDQARAVRLLPGRLTSNIDIRLELVPSVSLHGVVSNLPEQHQPFTIVLQFDSADRRGPQQLYRVVPGHHNFSFRSVPPGRYVLRANLRAGQEHLAARKILEVGTVPLENIVLELQPLFSIKGTVLFNQRHASAPNIELYLAGTDTQSIFRIETDSLGRFQSPMLSPGTYTIRVKDSEQKVYVKSIKVGEVAVRGRELELSHGDSSVTVTLGDDSGLIYGSVTADQQLSPKGGFAILVPAIEGGFVATSLIRADRSFSFPGVVPGRYRLGCFETREVSRYLSRDLIRRVEEEGRPIEIPPNGLIRVDAGVLRMAPGS